MKRVKVFIRLTKKNFCSAEGFSLVELLVVILIVGVLVVTLVALFDPFAQIQKAKNSQREQNLIQIKNALDTYFNDSGCYPHTIPFGGKWASGAAVYMQTVPEDPDCTPNSLQNCYNYQTDKSSCPQWNILYASLHAPVTSSMTTCVLSNVSNCTPSGGLLGYNYCDVSGKLDCNYISANPLPTLVPPIFPTRVPTPTPKPPTPTPTLIKKTTPTPTPKGPTPTPTPVKGVATPTPTPTSAPCSKNYTCAGLPSRCSGVFPPGSGTYCTSNCNNACGNGVPVL